MLGVLPQTALWRLSRGLWAKSNSDSISQVLHGYPQRKEIERDIGTENGCSRPTGMESDLSRPVIEIEASGELTHEMFAFGSEIAVVPVSGEGGATSPQ